MPPYLMASLGSARCGPRSVRFLSIFPLLTPSSSQTPLLCRPSDERTYARSTQ